MPITKGTRIGPFEVMGILGAGGMGEVYQARDSNLNRNVALKFLPDPLAHDSERLARFRREAQTLASLNHPNIAQIYGIEVSDAASCIVMELVQGETLQQRIARGPLPVDEALAIADQIAAALGAAHDKGVVHRDLKPGNVMLTVEGQVKVLDFGLARNAEANSGNPALPDSPTLASMPTAAGVILGTAAYMSPEQARGKLVDRRADIWAFGVVLYEMLTGTLLFKGEDLTETLASIVMKDPDLSAAPIQVRRLLRQCLEKDPKNRLRDIGDMRLLIDRERTPSPAPARWRTGVLATLAVVLAAVALAGWLRSSAPPVAAEDLSLSINPGADLLDPVGELDSTPFVSPDGSAVIFYTSAGSNWVRLRRLKTTEVIPVVANGIRNLGFWSPDSKSFFFADNATLKKLLVPDGAAETVANGMPGLLLGGTVSSSGTVLLAAVKAVVQLYMVSPSQTEIKAVELPGELDQCSTLWPQFLPDSEDFLFMCQTPGEERIVYMASLRGGKAENPTRLMNNNTAAHFTPAGGGQLLFVRDDNLYAQRLNRATRKLEGEPQLLQSGVGSSPAFFQAHFTVSRTGVIAWRNGREGLSQVAILDRKGAVIGSAGSAALIQTLRLSPDESRLLASYSRSAWLLEPGKSGSLKLERGSQEMVFSPDGSKLLTIERNANGSRVVEVPVDGSQATRDLLTLPGQFSRLQDLSRDGKTLLLHRGAFDTSIFSVTLDAPRAEPTSLVQTGEAIINSSFAPDGHWILYQASGRGMSGIYVQPFPGPGLRKEIASNGGYPVWRKDGREIVYIGDHMGRPYIWSVMVETSGSEIKATTPAPLFPVRLPAATFGDLNFLAVSRDGSRFFIPQAVEQPKSDLIHVRIGGIKTP